MDAVLREKLINLDQQNEALAEAEGLYLLKKAEVESFKEELESVEADIFLGLIGSIAERNAKVKTEELYTTSLVTFRNLRNELAELQKKFNFEKRKYEILENAFYAELNTFKREMGMIEKQRG